MIPDPRCAPDRPLFFSLCQDELPERRIQATSSIGFRGFEHLMVFKFNICFAGAIGRDCFLGVIPFLIPCLSHQQVVGDVSGTSEPTLCGFYDMEPLDDFRQRACPPSKRIRLTLVSSRETDHKEAPTVLIPGVVGIIDRIFDRRPTGRGMPFCRVLIFGCFNGTQRADIQFICLRWRRAYWQPLAVCCS